jgi:pheromone shutdown protein TraB
MVKSKKAATLSVWLEVMFFSILFVVVLGLLGNNMNSLYGDNKDLTFGIATNNTLQDLKTTQIALDKATQEGQSGFSSLGIFTLTTLPTMLMTTIKMITSFVSGGWIKSLVDLMNLGDYAGIVTTVFQVLYFFIVIFLLIKLLLRVQI